MNEEYSMEQAFIERLTEIVEKNLDNENFGVRELAREAGVSRSQMHRKLKRLTGQSGSRFIREIRLERALKLLRENAGTVSEIAYRVGFNSPSYFSTCFHDYYGVPPGEATKEEFVEKNKKVLTGKEGKQSVQSTGEFFNRRRILLSGVLVLLLSAAFYLYYQPFQPPEHPEVSIAVLPLDNLTGDSTLTYYVDGLHDALIGELGRLSHPRVISRTSTLQFRKPTERLADIAGQLNVSHIIEGSVLSVEDSIRIQLQLIQISPNERHLWAANYHRNIKNILAIFKEVTKEIADRVRITLTSREIENFRKTTTVNPETYKAYLRGMYYINKSTEADVRKGLNYLQEAVDNDPGDPRAYAGLAQGFINLGHGPTPSRNAFQRAKAAALTAIRMDSSLAQAHSALASYKLYYERDWRGAEQAFKKANRLNPNLPWNRYHYAWYLNLMGREKEAIEQHLLAHELDPLNPYINGWLGWLYAHYGHNDRAKEEADKTLMLNSKHPVGLHALARIFMGQKEYEKAVSVLKKAVEASPSKRGVLGYAMAKAGQTDQALEILNSLKQEEMNSFKALQIASIHAGLGDKQEAIHWLLYQPPHGVAPWASRMIRFDTLRSYPQYDQFLDRFNLYDLTKTNTLSADKITSQK